MTEDRFAMVSEWMTNGNVTQFVRTHRDANRFELVGLPLKFLSVVTDDDGISAVGRRREGFDLYAWSGNGSWGPQRGASSRTAVT